MGLQSWIIDTGFYVLVPGFLAPGSRFWGKGFEFWAPVHSVVIKVWKVLQSETEKCYKIWQVFQCDKELLQIATNAQSET